MVDANFNPNLLDLQQAQQYLGGVDLTKFDAADGNKDGNIDLSKIQLFAKDKDGKMVRVTSTDQLTDGSLSFNTTQTVSSVDMNVKGLHVESNYAHIGGDAASIDAKGEGSIVDLDEGTIKGKLTTSETTLEDAKFVDPNNKSLVPSGIGRKINGCDDAFVRMLTEAGVTDVKYTKTPDDKHFKGYITFTSAAGWSIRMKTNGDDKIVQPKITVDQETGAYRFQNLRNGALTLKGTENIILGSGCYSLDVYCKDGLQENITVASKNTPEYATRIKIHTNEGDGIKVDDGVKLDTEIMSGKKVTGKYVGANLTELAEDSDGNKNIRFTYDKNNKLSQKTYTDKAGVNHEEKFDENGTLLTSTLRFKDNESGISHEEVYDKNGKLEKNTLTGANGNKTVEDYVDGVLTKKVYDGTTEIYQNGQLFTKEKGNTIEYYNKDGNLEKTEVKSNYKRTFYVKDKGSFRKVYNAPRDVVKTYDADGKMLKMTVVGANKDDALNAEITYAPDGETASAYTIERKEQDGLRYKYTKSIKTDKKGNTVVTYTTYKLDADRDDDKQWTTTISYNSNGVPVKGHTTNNCGLGSDETDSSKLIARVKYIDKANLFIEDDA